MASDSDTDEFWTVAGVIIVLVIAIIGMIAITITSGC
jgi:hypothetical protein